MDYLIARFIAWYAAQPIHLIGFQSILLGSALSSLACLNLLADGWPVAFSAYFAPILVWIACAWVVQRAERPRT